MLRLTKKQADELRRRHPGILGADDAPATPTKFRNRKAFRTDADTGVTLAFDSEAEARRYDELAAQHRDGVIAELELQASIPVVVNGVRVCRYVCDFRYRLLGTGEIVVEDVKSPATRKLPTYRLKKKLIAALYGITVVEVVCPRPIGKAPRRVGRRGASTL